MNNDLNAILAAGHSIALPTNDAIAQQDSEMKHLPVPQCHLPSVGLF
jgi:hypothetical protein